MREAKTIAKSLLKAKLIACANIVKADSLYQWKGRVVRSGEALLLMKSTSKNFTAIEKAVKKMSSYECPCVLALQIENGSKGYLDWLKGSVL